MPALAGQPKVTVNATEVIYEKPIPIERGPTLADKLKVVMKEKLAEAAELTREELIIAKDVAKANLPIVVEMAKDSLKVGLQTTKYLANEGFVAAKEGFAQAKQMMNCVPQRHLTEDTYIGIAPTQQYAMTRLESGFSDRELYNETEMPNIQQLNISEQPKFHFDNQNSEPVNNDLRLGEVNAQPTMLGSAFL